MAKTKKAAGPTLGANEVPPWGEGEADIIEDVTRQVYVFLKQGIVSGRTCDYSPEMDKLRHGTIKLYGSNGKTFTLTISR